MPAQLRKLSDCAEILPGFSLKARAEHEPGGTHQVIMAKHVSNSLIYDYTDAHELRMSPKGLVHKYLVKAGDVLFISRGTRNHAAVVNRVPQHTIASATFYILRVKRDLEPAYLAWSLNQSSIQAQIAQVRTGAGTPIVQRKLLGDLEIPTPSVKNQHLIVEVGELMMQEKALCQKLNTIIELKHNLIGQQLLQHNPAIDLPGE